MKVHWWDHRRRLMTDRESGAVDLRKYFRVKYPVDDYPEVMIGNAAFKVQDVSERGIRILNATDAKFSDWIQGTLQFSDSELFEIEGRSVWKSGRELGLKLVASPIPPRRIMKEQQRLKARMKPNEEFFEDE